MCSWIHPYIIVTNLLIVQWPPLVGIPAAPALTTKTLFKLCPWELIFFLLLPLSLSDQEPVELEKLLHRLLVSLWEEDIEERKSSLMNSVFLELLGSLPKRVKVWVQHPPFVVPYFFLVLALFNSYIQVVLNACMTFWTTKTANLKSFISPKIVIY